MTTRVRKAVAEEVALELRRAGRLTPWLAVKAGIPYSTLNRKLRAQADFTVTDLAKIAGALGVSPSAFTPDLCVSAPHRGSALKPPGTRRRGARTSLVGSFSEAD